MNRLKKHLLLIPLLLLVPLLLLGNLGTRPKRSCDTADHSGIVTLYYVNGTQSSTEVSVSELGYCYPPNILLTLMTPSDPVPGIDQLSAIPFGADEIIVTGLLDQAFTGELDIYWMTVAIEP